MRKTGSVLIQQDLFNKKSASSDICSSTPQGTAGESMKAFLNKTIRENKSAAIVNLGKGKESERDRKRSKLFHNMFAMLAELCVRTHVYSNQS